MIICETVANTDINTGGTRKQERMFEEVLISLFFGYTVRLAGPYFLNQGFNLCPQRYIHGVLTTGGCLVAKSCLTLVTPWTVACQVPLSIGFSRQEYWNGLPFHPSRDLPDPGIEPVSPTLAGEFFTTEPPGKPPTML